MRSQSQLVCSGGTSASALGSVALKVYSPSTDRVLR